MKTQKLFLILFVLFMYSCKCDKEVVNSNSSLISVKLDSLHSVDLSALVSTITYIPLETLDESIISTIDKVIFYKNSFFILDCKRGEIIVFDKNGKYQKKLSKKGLGPEEYFSISDFDIDRVNGRVIISDDIGRKFNVYSSSFDYVKTFKADFHNSCCAFQDSCIVYYSNNLTKDKNLHIMNLRTRKTDSFLSIDENLRKFHSGSLKLFTLDNNHNILFQEPLAQRIYKIEGGDLIEAYNIDFGIHNRPENYFLSAKSLQKLLFDLNKKAAYPQLLSVIGENIFFSFGYMFSRKYVIYNKKNMTIDCFDIKNNIDHNPFFEPQFVDSSFMIATRESGLLLESYDFFLKNNQQVILNPNSNIVSCLKQISINDNPVLVKYELK